MRWAGFVVVLLWPVLAAAQHPPGVLDTLDAAPRHGDAMPNTVEKLEALIASVEKDMAAVKAGKIRSALKQPVRVIERPKQPAEYVFRNEEARTAQIRKLNQLWYAARNALEVVRAKQEERVLDPLALKAGAVGPLLWGVKVIRVLGPSEMIVLVRHQLHFNRDTPSQEMNPRLSDQVQILVRNIDTKDIAEDQPMELRGRFRVAEPQRIRGNRMFIIEALTDPAKKSS